MRASAVATRLNRPPRRSRIPRATSVLTRAYPPTTPSVTTLSGRLRRRNDGHTPPGWRRQGLRCCYGVIERRTGARPAVTGGPLRRFRSVYAARRAR